MTYCCIYLTNRARLLAASSSITWHASSQHLFRLGSLLPGYRELLLPEQTQRSSIALRCSLRTCESPSLLLTLSLSDLQQRCLLCALPTLAVKHSVCFSVP